MNIQEVIAYILMILLYVSFIIGMLLITRPTEPFMHKCSISGGGVLLIEEGKLCTDALDVQCPSNYAEVNRNDTVVTCQPTRMCPIGYLQHISGSELLCEGIVSRGVAPIARSVDFPFGYERWPRDFR